MCSRTGAIATFVVFGWAVAFAAADVLQLPTQTLTGYIPGYTGNSQFINGNFVPVLEEDAYSPQPPRTAGPFSYAPGEQVIEAVTAPPGERIVLTPGTAPTYVVLYAVFAHMGSSSSVGAPAPLVSFGGAEGTPPQVDFNSFVTGTDPSGGMEFSGHWQVTAPFSFTSVTFTGTVAQQSPPSNQTYNDVDAQLMVYEPYPPGSTSDQLLNVQPIPEPAQLGAVLGLTSALLLRRRQTSPLFA